MSNDIGVISFENMKRMEARRAKVDETLLQAAEMQQMADHTDQLISEVMRQQRSHLNKQVYDLAEQKDVSIYDICLQYMPQMPEPQIRHTNYGTFSYEQEIRLVPMPFEPEPSAMTILQECDAITEALSKKQSAQDFRISSQDIVACAGLSGSFEMGFCEGIIVALDCLHPLDREAALREICNGIKASAADKSRGQGR